MMIESIRLALAKTDALLRNFLDMPQSPLSIMHSTAWGPKWKSCNAAEENNTTPPIIFHAMMLAGGLEWPFGSMNEPNPTILSESNIPVIETVNRQIHPSQRNFAPMSLRKTIYS